MPQMQSATFAALLDAAAESIVTIDSRGIITLANLATERIFGYRRDELLGQNITILMTPLEARNHDRYVARYVNGGPAAIIGIGRRVTAKHKDGRALPIHLSVGEWVIDGERQFIGIMHDLSEQVRIEEDLHRAQQMEALGRVVGGIAHDFNNLLVPILALTKMVLRDLPEDNSARRDLENVAKAAKRGSALVNAILTFSKHQPPDLQPVDLGTVVAEATELVRASAPSNITITTQSNLPRHRVLVDPDQVHRVILNLVSNSLQAIGAADGRIDISLEQETLATPKIVGGVQLKPGRYARLSVRDDGAGIETKIMPHIFEPLFTARPKQDGAGMGLAIVHGIVAAHGGAITVESTEGKGALFEMLLPWQECPD